MRSLLQAQGHRIEVQPTTGPMTAGAIAADAISAGADAILVAGGDGTVNEVVNGMAGTPVPLGVIPVGTANVLGMELGIGRNPLRTAQRLPEMVPRRIALGRVQCAGHSPRYYICMCGVGLDAMIVYHIDAGLKSRFGKVAYWITGFRQLGRRLPEFDAEIDGHRTSASFALTSRVRNYGGDLNIARDASLLGSDLAAVVFAGSRSTPYLKYLAGVLSGRLSKMQGVRVALVQEARFECASDPRIYVQVDGEYAGRLPARTELIPDALTLLVPPEFARAHG